HGKRLIALPFVIQEEERLVLDDGTTNGGVELIVVNIGFLAFTRSRTVVRVVVGKVIRRISEPVVIDPRRRSMPVIGAAFHVQQNRRSALDAEFGRRRFLNAQFLNRFWRKNGSWNADDSGFSDSGVAIVAVVIVET